MNIVYTVLFYLALPFILLRLWWKGAKLPEYRQRISERLGFYSTEKIDDCIWLHAVSYGETMASRALVNELLLRYPETPLLITNMTVTGSQCVNKQFNGRVKNVYVPYDLPDVIGRFMQHFNPKICIIMETELWPNLLKACRHKNIPVMLANARLSAKSTRGYARIKHLTKKTLGAIHVIAAQSETDAKRFSSLGAENNTIVTTGNLKNDLIPPRDQLELGKSVRASWPTPRNVITAASTHKGEETVVLEAFKRIKQLDSDCLLVLVPRHPERFDEVAKLCEESGFSYKRQTENPNIDDTIDILLGDTMGEMYYFYSLADIAFVGGSIAPIGGHNILEPIFVGIPVITGPHLFHIAEMQELFPKGQARIEVNDAEELADAILSLFEDPSKKQALVDASQETLHATQGALEKHLKMIEGLMGTPVILPNARTQKKQEKTGSSRSQG